MREILFRGKRIDNGEWVQGYYVCLDKKTHFILTGKSAYANGCYKSSKYEVIPETVGQYTGLTDKNGKKIFERDIVWGDDVTWTWHKGVIEYDESIGSFIINAQKFTQYRKNENNYDLLGNWNVEGNIHDNPEILEVHNG